MEANYIWVLFLSFAFVLFILGVLFTYKQFKIRKKEMKEYIVCAAIHNPEEKDMSNEPLIYCGLRHHNILWQSKLVSRNLHHQGFLTSKGRFVDRKEGLRIALDNDQVIDHSQIRGDNLYSEDLY